MMWINDTYKVMILQMVLEEKQEAGMKSSAATKDEDTKLLSRFGGHLANIKNCNAGNLKWKNSLGTYKGGGE